MRSIVLHRRWGSIWIGTSALCAACGDTASPASPPSPPITAPAAPDMAPDPSAAEGSAPSDIGAATTSSASAANENEATVDPNIDLAPSDVGDDDNDAQGVASSPLNPPVDAGSNTPVPPEEEPDTTPTGPITVFLAGDSIVQTYADTPSDSDQAGWGQMLGEYFDERVTVENRAIGGRTARRFIDEGRLDALLEELEPGNVLLVQFGTNDGNRTATYTIGDETIPYFLDPATDFKTYLQRYVDAAQSRGAIPVFVTPTPRNSAYCIGGNGTGGHAASMRELGLAIGVPVVDLNTSTVEYLRAICPAPIPEDFFLLRADGTVDGTHFQERGARILAGFVADGLSVPGLPFAAYRAAAP